MAASVSAAELEGTVTPREEPVESTKTPITEAPGNDVAGWLEFAARTFPHSPRSAVLQSESARHAPCRNRSFLHDHHATTEPGEGWAKDKKVTIVALSFCAHNCNRCHHSPHATRSPPPDACTPSDDLPPPLPPLFPPPPPPPSLPTTGPVPLRLTLALLCPLQGFTRSVSWIRLGFSKRSGENFGVTEPIDYAESHNPTVVAMVEEQFPGALAEEEFIDKVGRRTPPHPTAPHRGTTTASPNGGINIKVPPSHPTNVLPPHRPAAPPPRRPSTPLCHVFTTSSRHHSTPPTLAVDHVA